MARFVLLACLAAVAFGIIWPFFAGTPGADQIDPVSAPIGSTQIAPPRFMGPLANAARTSSLCLAFIAVAIPVVILMRRKTAPAMAFSLCLLLVLLLASLLPQYLDGFGWEFLNAVGLTQILYPLVAGSFATVAFQVANRTGSEVADPTRAHPLARIWIVVAVATGIAGTLAVALYPYSDSSHSPWIALALPWGILQAYLVARGIAFVRASLSRLQGVERSQFLWLLQGLLVGCVIAIITVGLMPAIFGAIAGFTEAATGEARRFMAYVVVLEFGPVLSVIIVAISVNIAMFARGAFDAALKSSAVYGLLAPIFVFLFAAVESALSDWVEGQVALPRSVAPALAGGGLALLLIPIKRQLDRRVAAIINPKTGAVSGE